MSTIVSFTVSAFANGGIKGDLVPDADGYVTLVVGGLNVHNARGDYYVAEGARQLFAEDSDLMRRIKDGVLAAELEHPKKLSNESEYDFYDRFCSIDKNNVCATFGKIWLDDQLLASDGIVAIMAKVIPSGMKADALRSSLSNRMENICFSIRGITEDTQVGGKWIRKLVKVITFDLVLEPGIPIAKKWFSPSLETLATTTTTNLKRYLGKHNGRSTESSDALAGVVNAIESARNVPVAFTPVTRPKTMGW